MKQIQSGDVVWLKSGGSSMTVHSTDAETARCDWFENGEHKQAIFRIEQLIGEEPQPR